MKKGIIPLKAEVLFAGVGCPVCGEQKTSRARTCLKCFKSLGMEVTRRVNAVAEACEQAVKGHEVAASGNVPRDIVWGPVLANLHLDVNAQFHPARGKFKPYWEIKRGVPGGFVQIFIFDAAGRIKLGDNFTGLVQLKRKVVDEKVVHYLRVQVVEDVTSNLRLAVLPTTQSNRIMTTLPNTVAIDEGYMFAAGFLPAVVTKHMADEQTAQEIGPASATA